VGSSFIRDKTIYSEDEENGVVFSRIKKTDLWGGLSHSLRAIRANIFAMFRLTRTRFEERPEVESNLNPAYHESDELLGSIGLYREHFLTTNMIYGYGTREYIGTGYQAEVIGGYHWVSTTTATTWAASSRRVNSSLGATPSAEYRWAPTYAPTMVLGFVASARSI
jgi:hypothetical protein